MAQEMWVVLYLFVCTSFVMNFHVYVYTDSTSLYVLMFNTYRYTVYVSGEFPTLPLSTPPVGSSLWPLGRNYSQM